MVIEASGVRIGWADLPAPLRAYVEQLLGGSVVRAETQRGGFSPGSADRVVVTTGRRAFVKAVSAQLNRHSPSLHRREGLVSAVLPPTIPAPHLLGHYDDGDWVALVFEDADGHPPALPWRADELTVVRQALQLLAETPLPPALTTLPSTGELLGDDVAGWTRLAADPDPQLPPWATAHLHLLVAVADRAPGVLDEANSLVHTDVRADNVLLREGQAVLVDWPWASRGPAWFDPLCLLVNVGLYDVAHHVDLDAEWQRWFPEVAAADVDAVLAGVGGYFLDYARRPAPPGLPTIRPFQRAQGLVVVDWLRRRLDRSTAR